jgi:hypothetical protein
MLASDNAGSCLTKGELAFHIRGHCSTSAVFVSGLSTPAVQFHLPDFCRHKPQGLPPPLHAHSIHLLPLRLLIAKGARLPLELPFETPKDIDCLANPACGLDMQNVHICPTELGAGRCQRGGG